MSMYRLRSVLMVLENRFIPLAAMLAFVVCVNGCISSGVVTPKITFLIESTPDTNDKQPFYIVIRSVNEKNFLTKNYQSIANMVFSNTPNPDVLTSQVILPGEAKKIELEKPSRDNIAFYCLFSKPGDKWKAMVNQPLDSEYVIELRGSDIAKKIYVRKKSMWEKIYSFLFDW